MKFSFVLLTVCLISASCAAQDICGQLKGIDASFSDAYKKVIGINNPSASDRAELKDLYSSYRQFLAENKATGMGAAVALKIISQYAYVLLQEKKFKEGLAEIRFGMDNFIEHIERGGEWCYVAFKGNISYDENAVQDNVDNFLCAGTLLCFELNETAYAQQILMKVAERDLIGSNPPMNIAAAKIFKYKMNRQEFDDTCFYAAYGAMLSDYEEKSVTQAMNDLNDAIQNLHSSNGVSTIKVITDPKRISYRPPMVKRYKYLNFYDYYIRLYKYLVEKKSDIFFQHETLKMFLKTFNADKNGGIDVAFLHTLARGTNFSPDAIKEIIKEGDKELIGLLADFIWKYCSSKDDDMVLIYGGYLCYYNLGDKKTGDKLYKKLNQFKERFPKLE